MAGRATFIRKAFKEMKIIAYRAARYIYRKLKNECGIDALNLKLPFSGRTLKGLIYPGIRLNTVRESATRPPIYKIPKRKPGQYILFVRTIGNDIQGLHDENQSLGNLEYILKNEGELPGVDKLFIINRVVSRHKLEKIVRLLRYYKMPYLELAFEADRFKEIPLVEQPTPGEGENCIRALPDLRELVHKVAIRSHRSAYLLNNLGAKNFALNCGAKNGYKWVLPWDGNCILSNEEFLKIKKAIDSAGKKAKYFLASMERCPQEPSMLRPSPADNVASGRQLILRASSKNSIDLSQFFSGGRKPQGLSSEMPSGLRDAWIYEQACGASDFLNDRGMSDSPENGAALVSLGEAIAKCSPAGLGMDSRPSSIIDFIDEIYDYSTRKLAGKSQVDYLYYRQVKADQSKCPENCVELSAVFDKVYLVSLEHDLEKRIKVGFQLRSLGIDYDWYPAVNGYEGRPLQDFQEYMKRPLGKMAHFSDCSDYEKRRGSKMIESPGALGYIYTYISIMNDAKSRGFKNILIVEDDIILCYDFKQRFHRFITSVSDDWRILLLGASQYDWGGVDVSESLKRGFYRPELHKTKGSFAIGVNESIFDELIENLSYLDAPFDNFPIGYLYEKYQSSCFVAYPYLVMPDVGDSAIRGARSQYTHSNRVGWWVSDFKYPAQKPCVGVVLKSSDNLRLLDFKADPGLPYLVNFYFVNENGISPLHNRAMLPSEYHVENVNDQLYASTSLTLDVLFEAEKETPLSEKDIHDAVLDTLSGGSTSGPLKEVNLSVEERVAGRVSVVIPTYKRSEHLQRAVESVLEQDYHDTELIVVDDNGVDSSFSRETSQVIKDCGKRYPKRRIRMVQHVKNANGAAARNSGIFASTGEYICFLDDDDIYLPGRISKSVQELIGSSESIGAVYCGFLGWNSPRLDLGRFKDGDLTREIFMLDYFRHYLHTNTATYKASAILAVNGFDESYRRHQDLEFNLRFFEQFQIGVVREALVRLAPEKSAVDNKLYGADMLNLKRKFLTDFEYLIAKFSEEEQRRIYDVHCREVSRYTGELASNMDIYEFISGGNVSDNVRLSLAAD
ncbi:glycosyltransferase [Microbulbifer sp. JSM ZJ756]|uniref:glycosyltransferase n=1 Tax=Microbulbifer sp. JSM ZJ756 TaxID=3376191 RepID=UPI0037BA6666